MGIEPTHQLFTGALVLKTRRPTRRLGTSVCLILAQERPFFNGYKGHTTI
jgi:hypothetical protein